MTLQEAKTLCYQPITTNDRFYLVMTYDTGDEDDTNNFTGKVEDILQYFNIEEYDIIDLPSSDPDYGDWTVVDVSLSTEDIPLQTMKKIFDRIDQI